MARKSKAKFKMPGHSIPGIKGFKGTALEDGRAASSAFQMKSPVKQDNKTELEFDDAGIEETYDKNMEKAETDKYVSDYKGNPEGWDWAIYEIAQWDKRRKANDPSTEEEMVDDTALTMKSPVKQDVIKEQLDKEGNANTFDPNIKPIDTGDLDPRRQAAATEDPRNKMLPPSPPPPPDEKEVMGERIQREQFMDPDKFGGMNPRRMMQIPTRDGSVVYVDEETGKRYNEDGTPYQRHRERP